MSVKSFLDGTASNSTTAKLGTITATTVACTNANVGTLNTTNLTTNNSFINCDKTMQMKGFYAVTGTPDVYPFTVSGVNGGLASTTVRSSVVSDTPVALVVGQGGGIGVASSTRESKMNFNPNFSTEPLSRLKVYSYNYRQTDSDGKYTDVPVVGERVGLIYDEVKQVCPSLCIDSKDGKPITVDYSTNLVCMMLKRIQELEVIISAIRTKVSV